MVIVSMIALVIAALASVPIAFVVYAFTIGKERNTPALIIAGGGFAALPWAVLWACARLNRFSCPARGPCMADGKKTCSGELLLLYAIPLTFVFGAISAWAIARLDRK